MTLSDNTDGILNSDNKLAEDNDTPFSPPDDTEGQLKVDHPATDSNIDEHEAYDEGLSGATEAKNI